MTENAKTQFQKLGFSLFYEKDSYLIYKFKTDYDNLYIHFNFELKTYYVGWERFIDNAERVFVPMKERPEATKHSAFYGHWQRETVVEIDSRIHNAIHQQLIELGWI